MPDLVLRQEGVSGYVLLVACADPDEGKAGGIYSFDGRLTRRIDSVDSSGVALAGDHLVRLRWSHAADDTGLFVYDAGGLKHYHRLDGLGDAHQVAWDGEHFVVVSTATNRLVWVSPAGECKEWKAPGEGDAWHLNGLFLFDNDIFVSAFGRFFTDRAWDKCRNSHCGIVFRLSTGADVLSRLNCPHHARYMDGAWVVCNSSDHDLLQIRDGMVQRRVCLGGWTRGIAVSDDFLFVGVSAPRHDRDAAVQTGSIAVLSRTSWEIQCVLPIAAREISDLALVPLSLAEGVRRAGALDSFGLETPRMRPIHPGDADQFHVEPVEVPDAVVAGREFECMVRVVNRSNYLLQSAPANPVHLSYHWLDQESVPVVFDGLRTRLQPVLYPEMANTYRLTVRSPEEDGVYRLRLTLVQEGVRWFDTPPTNAYFDAHVSVVRSIP
ncbi:MAG TPA: DUF4915 domain-containing protein [Bryobacteraceae bacterium]|nr:DUF4915 domain-containing protein [Bryobacteraceae bacterium]